MPEILTPLERQVLELFRSRDGASPADVAVELGISVAAAGAICRELEAEGYLAGTSPTLPDCQHVRGGLIHAASGRGRAVEEREDED